MQTSRYSKLGGVPVAVLGLGGYVLILGSLWLRGEAGKLAGAALALMGFGFSAYLTYRELFTIKAICQWCVANAIVLTALAALTVWRLLRLEETDIGRTGSPEAIETSRIQKRTRSA